MISRRTIVLGAAAVAWPSAAYAQQKAMPVIGWLSSGSPGPYAPSVAAFRRGLSDAGEAMSGCPPWLPTSLPARSM